MLGSAAVRFFLLGILVLQCPFLAVGQPQAAVYLFSVLNADNSHHPACEYPEPTFILQCGAAGGQIELLNDDESLGLLPSSACVTINAQALSCTVPRRTLAEPLTAAYVAFRCLGSSADEWVATATVEAVEGVDCSAAFQYGRLVSLQQVCRQTPPVDETIGTAVGAQDISGLTCQIGGQPMGLDFGLCSSYYSFDQVIVSVPQSGIITSCLYEAQEPVPQALPAGPQTAIYSAGITLGATDDNVCDFNGLSQVTWECGEGGSLQALIGVVDLNTGIPILAPPDGVEFWSDAQLTEIGCQRQENRRRIVCPTLLSRGQLVAAGYVACTGTTTAAVSLHVRVDPAPMNCQGGASFEGIVYTASNQQLCPELPEDTYPLYAPPQNQAAALFAHECAPVTSYQYQTLSQQVEVDIDGDGEPDTTRQVDVPQFRCEQSRFTCQQNGLCDGNGNQNLGPLQARIPPQNVRLDCLVESDTTTPDRSSTSSPAQASPTGDMDTDDGASPDNNESSGGVVHHPAWRLRFAWLAWLSFFAAV